MRIMERRMTRGRRRARRRVDASLSPSSSSSMVVVVVNGERVEVEVVGDGVPASSGVSPARRGVSSGGSVSLCTERVGDLAMGAGSEVGVGLGVWGVEIGVAGVTCAFAEGYK
jgi:hypothetical protein